MLRLIYKHKIVHLELAKPKIVKYFDSYLQAQWKKPNIKGRFINNKCIQLVWKGKKREDYLLVYRVYKDKKENYLAFPIYYDSLQIWRVSLKGINHLKIHGVRKHPLK